MPLENLISLTNLFRLHAVLGAIYALVILLFPREVIFLLSDELISNVGTDVTRLFGAALALVTILTWGASRLKDIEARRVIALSLLVYTTLGAIITLLGQFVGTWNLFGWSSIVTYVIFVIGYAYFLFIRPEEAEK
ncbi:MAG: hypothetical protein ACFFCZ_22595 [Promethearchaeota archaeon]